MFKDGKNRIDVTIALNLGACEAIDLFYHYLKRSDQSGLVTIHDYFGNDLPLFLELFDKMKYEGIVTR